MSLVEGKMNGASGGNVSIYNYQSMMFLRDIEVNGYETSVYQVTYNGDNIINKDRYITEFHSHQTIALFPGSANTTLNLSVIETPRANWESADQWQSGLMSGHSLNMFILIHYISYSK